VLGAYIEGETARDKLSRDTQLGIEESSEERYS
jgi:hypothetical protein